MGILFMNKVDYTTYHRDITEYKHGIQMIPLKLFPHLFGKIIYGSRMGSTVVQYHW